MTHRYPNARGRRSNMGNMKSLDMAKKLAAAGDVAGARRIVAGLPPRPIVIEVSQLSPDPKDWRRRSR